MKATEIVSRIYESTSGLDRLVERDTIEINEDYEIPFFLACDIAAKLPLNVDLENIDHHLQALRATHEVLYEHAIMSTDLIDLAAAYVYAKAEVELFDEQEAGFIDTRLEQYALAYKSLARITKMILNKSPDNKRAEIAEELIKFDREIMLQADRLGKRVGAAFSAVYLAESYAELARVTLRDVDHKLSQGKYTQGQERGMLDPIVELYIESVNHYWQAFQAFGDISKNGEETHEIAKKSKEIEVVAPGVVGEYEAIMRRINPRISEHPAYKLFIENMQKAS
jgi:hypothetical protein